MALLLGLTLLLIGGYLAVAPWDSVGAAGRPGTWEILVRLLLSSPFALLAIYGASLALRFLAPELATRLARRLWWLRGVAALGLGLPLAVGAAIEAWVSRAPRGLGGALLFAGLAVAGALDLRRQRRRRAG